MPVCRPCLVPSWAVQLIAHSPVAKAYHPSDNRISESVKGYSDSFHHSNDWKANPNGQDYLAALRSFRPDVQRRASEVLATLGSHISRVENEFAAKHGWTPNANTRIWETNPVCKKYEAENPRQC